MKNLLLTVLIAFALQAAAHAATRVEFLNQNTLSQQPRGGDAIAVHMRGIFGDRQRGRNASEAFARMSTEQMAANLSRYQAQYATQDAKSLLLDLEGSLSIYRSPKMLDATNRAIEAARTVWPGATVGLYSFPPGPGETADSYSRRHQFAAQALESGALRADWIGQSVYQKNPPQSVQDGWVSEVMERTRLALSIYPVERVRLVLSHMVNGTPQARSGATIASIDPQLKSLRAQIETAERAGVSVVYLWEGEDTASRMAALELLDLDTVVDDGGGVGEAGDDGGGDGGQSSLRERVSTLEEQVERLECLVQTRPRDRDGACDN